MLSTQFLILWATGEGKGIQGVPAAGVGVNTKPPLISYSERRSNLFVKRSFASYVTRINDKNSSQRSRISCQSNARRRLGLIVEVLAPIAKRKELQDFGIISR